MDLRIVTLVGEPGSGKTTIADALLSLRPELYRTLISNTTREKRPTDGPGDYRFVSREHIKEWESQGELAWSPAESAGHMYATRLDDIEAALADTGHLYISILVPETAEILYQLHPKNVLPLRIQADITLLPERLRLRGASTEDIEYRMGELGRWKKSFEAERLPYQVVTNNGSISDAVRAADRLIQSSLTN